MHPATFSVQKETRLSRPAGEKSHYYVIFRIDSQRYALPLDHVVRVLRMVAITPVPEMPEWVLGIINMAGQTLPVLDPRRLFSQKNQDPELQDRILILQVQEQTVAVVVDEVLSILEFTSEQIEAPPPALSHSLALAATIQQDDALVMVLDVYRLLPEKIEGNFSRETL